MWGGFFRNSLQRLNRCVDPFIPSQVAQDERRLSSDRQLISVCLITSLFSLFYVGISQLIGFRVGVGLMLGCFLLLYAILLLFKTTGRFRLCSNLYLACCCIVAVFGCSLFSGGLHSMVYPWFALIPVTGVLLLGYCRDTLFWFLFCTAVAIGYGIAYDLGIPFPELYRLEYLDFFYTVCITGLVMILFFIALTFHHNWSVALNKILEQNEELEKARQQAEAAARSKSEFLANMSHEIRTPMNAIVGCAALCQQTCLDDQQRGYLARIESASISLLGIVNDILDFSKIEAGKLALEQIDFSLEKVIDNIADMIGLRAAEKGLELVVSVDPTIPLNLVGDPLRLGQALLNLAGNAVKFTEAGSVLIQAAFEERDASSCLVRFTVKDTGIGMSEEEMSRLFVAFSQADTSVTRKFGGTGLGLAIAKNLTEMMGGKIDVESSPGQGSRFSFTCRFPLNPRLTASQQSLPSHLAGLRVLVVDDNALARQVLLTHLAGFRIRAEEVASGKAALQALARAAQKDPFDLVLMDWQMPDMDGLETVRRMRNELKLERLPVTIMVTAFGREEVMNQAEKDGINSLLIKPVSASLLLDTILQKFAPDTRAYKQEPAPAELQVNLDSIRGARVLVADDNSVNRQVAAELLRTAGMIPDIVVNGQEAIAAVLCTSYDLVFMDIQMPVMSGHEATSLIRAHRRFAELPIIAMTAHAMSGVREECLAAGMNDYLSKPVQPVQLYEMLARWIKPGDRTLPEEAQVGACGESFGCLPPKLEGFDLEEGLALLGNNHALYRQMIFDFVTRNIPMARKLPKLLREGRREEARKRLHALKGVASNLSASEIYRLVVELDKVLEGPSSAVEAPLIASLLKACDVIVDSVEQLRREEPEMISQGTGAEIPAASLLQELSRLVACNDSQALDLAQQLKGSADLHPAARSHLAALEAELSVYNFEQAARNLDNLMALREDLGEGDSRD